MRAAIALASCLLAACHYESEVRQVEFGGSFGESGAAEVVAQWWGTFDDPALQALVADAFAGNYGYRQAWARLRQSAAIRNGADATMWPSLGLNASSSAGRDKNGTTLIYGVTAAASYEISLFGANRALREAAEYSEAAVMADTQTLATSIAGEMATLWYGYSTTTKRLALVEKQVEAGVQFETLVELRFRSGGASASDVFRQRQVTESLRQQRSQLQSTMSTQQHAINVLRGKPPKSALPAPGESPELAPFPETGVPSEVLQRRPDVIAQLARLRAADASVEQAMRNRFPSLTFRATGGRQTSAVNALFGGWFSQFSANIFAPIFEGGARKAEVARTRAVAEENVYRLAEVMISAAQEIEDAIALDVQAKEVRASLEKQLEYAETSHNLAIKAFAKGQGDYLTVLGALTTQQSLAQQVLIAQRDERLARIRLYRALAGPIPISNPEEKQ